MAGDNRMQGTAATGDRAKGKRMSEDRLVDIEIKLAHQEQQLFDLDKVVTDQQARIMQLEQLVKSLIERVRAIGEGGADTAQDETPPHY
jgi:SlyX protein